MKKLDRYAPVAQLDRVLDYESRGQGFESLLARHLGVNVISFAPIFLKSQSALVLLLLLSKSNLRRCASI